MNLIPWKTKRDDTTGQLSVPGGFRSELDRLFDSFFRDAFDGGQGTMPLAAAAWAPPLDVEETDKEIHVRAEIPGMKSEDLNLAIVGNSLVISGEKKESQERREAGYIYQERRFGSFRREVPLPTAVDADNAQYKDGVLTVELKKSQEALPKRIAVKST